MIIIKSIGKFIFYVFLSIFSFYTMICTHLSYIDAFNLSKFYFYTVIFNFKNPKDNYNKFRLIFHRINWKKTVLTKDLFDKLYNNEKNTKSLDLIGNWFVLNEKKPEKIVYPHNSSSIHYFSIGREPFEYILSHHKFKNKCVMIPVFTCFTVFDPFIQNGWKFISYKITKDLKIDIINFNKLYDKYLPSICVFQEYSGINLDNQELNAISKVHKNGCLTIMDMTQNIYSSVKKDYIDYYCGSLRKWYSFPDGSFLYSDNYSIEQNNKKEKENNIFRTTKAISMYTYNNYFQSGNDYFSKIGAYFQSMAVSYIGGTKIKLHSMSYYSYSIYKTQNEEQNIKKRIQNYTYIYNRIKDNPLIIPVCTDLNRLTSAPLCFHIYADNQKKFAKYLAINCYMVQLLWSPPKYVLNDIANDDTTKFIYEHILSLPCDQRYSIEDMKKMCDIIDNYKKS